MRRIVLNRRAFAFCPRLVGGQTRVLLSSSSLYMSKQLHFLGKVALVTASLALAIAASAQNAFSPGGVNYPIAGALPGDQTLPHAAITGAGGYLVWQDNAADTNGLGIRAERLDALLNKSSLPFRVNATQAGDQEQPQVSILADGGAVFVWQGGKFGFQKIFARFIGPSGTTFPTGEILVNTYTNEYQIDPSVATLTDGSVVVVWSSYGQDGSLQGIYGQRLSSAGVKLGNEFQVNQFVLNNQRTPSVAALTNGGFVVTWVSELQRGASTVDIYARLFDNSGAAVGNEFPVNTSVSRICANPSVAASVDGGFAVGWSQRDVISTNSAASELTAPLTVPSTDSWDVYVRLFDTAGTATTLPTRMNTFTYGDQFAPKLSAFGKNYLAVWLSAGQDGSGTGVYGQFLTSAAELAGVEFQVNSDNGSRQISPTVCSDGLNRFLVTWSSYATSGDVELFARSYDLIRVNITSQGNGVRISWNTKPGRSYQLQTSSDYITWTNYGAIRVATAFSDYVDINSATTSAAYRVVRVQ